MFRVAGARDEARADQAADAIAGDRAPDPAALDGLAVQGPAALLPSVAARIRGLGGGAPLPEGLGAPLAAHPGFDLSRIRIHRDADAARLAGSLAARAFTTGTDIVFGAGEYAPHTARGRRLIAHELAHVAQQSTSASPVIQLASVRSYADSDPLHDPSRLTDAQIEATDEYQAIMALPVPAKGRRATPEEARLACRLLLRSMREGRPAVSGIYVWSNETLDAELVQWLATARARLGTTAMAEGAVGTQEWVAASAGDVQTPATAASHFTRWMLGGGTAPDPATGRLNCWEMVLFSAYRAGHVTEARLRSIYTTARNAMVTSGDAMAFPRTLESLLRSSNEHTYDPSDPNSPRPLRGDLVIFEQLANHVALATGRRVGGQIEIVSHWPPPDGSYNVKITTIEALLAVMPAVSVAKFWSPVW